VSTKRSYATFAQPVQTPLGVIEATGTPTYVDGFLTFGDYRPLADAHKQWLSTMPEDHTVAIDATVSTDGFVTSTLCGYATYAGPTPGDDLDNWHCGDGCCVPDLPTDEELTLGHYGNVLKVEERDDVVTHLLLEATLVGPTMVTFCLAHLWQEVQGGPLLPPTTVLTRPLRVFESLDHAGRVARKWQPPVTSGATPAF
jgi:hypothetical protein